MRHSVSPRESIEKEQQKTISSTNSNRSKKSASPIVMPPPPPPVWFIRNFVILGTIDKAKTSILEKSDWNKNFDL